MVQRPADVSMTDLMLRHDLATCLRKLPYVKNRLIVELLEQ
jgi:hypothetical protein